MIENPADLLGRSVEGPDVRRYLAAHDAESSVEPELDRTYSSLDRSGVELLAEGARTIQTVFLYGVGHETGHGPYVGPLPFGLSMECRQRQVRALLGAPAFETPAQDVQYLGRMGPIERYDLASCSIDIEYGDVDGQVVALTLMTPEAVPRGDAVH